MVVLTYGKLHLFKLCFQVFCTYLGGAHIFTKLINMASNVDLLKKKPCEQLNSKRIQNSLRAQIDYHFTFRIN